MPRFNSKNTLFVPSRGFGSLGVRNHISHPPAVPNQSSPANAASQAAGAIPLTWGAVPLAENYQVDIATNNLFTAGEQSHTVTSPTFTVTLAAGTFYWRVRSFGIDGYSAYSSVRTFTLT